MAESETTRTVPLQSRGASFQPKTVNEDARTVEIVWTTGARVLRGGLFSEPYYEELSLDPKSVDLRRLNNGAPLLNSHDSSSTSSVIGVVENARIDSGRGYATVRFARAEDDPAADQVFRKIKDGILQNISVGYRVLKAEDTGNKRDGVPIVMVTRWEPYELSVVPIGADDGAGTRGGGDSNSNQCVFVTRKQELATMSDEEKPVTPSAEKLEESVAVAATRAAQTARIEDAKSRAEAEQRAAEEAVAKERSRIDGIQKIAEQSGLGQSWAANLIRGGVSVEKARAAAFEYITKKETAEFNPDGTVRIQAGEDARDKQLRGAEAWLLERSGAHHLVEAGKKRFPKQFANVSLDGGEFRGMTPMDLARHFLERSNGVGSTKGMDRMRMIGQAFTQRGTNYQTTGDFPTLLENVMGKVLLGAYATQSNTWERFCKVEEVTDFRSSGRYRTGALPGLDVVSEHGEYTNGVVPDGSKYSISTQRYGKIFGLSQETIINDDMGALTQMATELGKSAMRTIENAVYALINDNGGLGPDMDDSNPFFDASHDNVNGTGSALSVTGIDADRMVMRAQMDSNGQDFLDLTPAILLVPDSLYGLGLEINDAQFDFDNAGTNTTGKFMRPNRVRGLFRDVIGTPRLTGTRRYLAADPNEAAWITVAFLQDFGRGPVIDSQNGWRVDGVEWKVSLYAKAQVSDTKAAVTNAGT